MNPITVEGGDSAETLQRLKIGGGALPLPLGQLGCPLADDLPPFCNLSLRTLTPKPVLS